MALTTSSKWLRIFGEGATGETASECAATSGVLFVRSQDELGVWNENATGRTFTAKEALRYFGEDRLREIWEEGVAILPATPVEPSRTLRERRVALGLEQNDLHRFTKMPLDKIAKAESPDYPSSIHDLSRLAIALGLDESILGYRPGANGDGALAVRLKEWRTEGEKPTTIVKLSAVTWIIATQHQLQQRLTPNSEPLVAFAQSDDYGNSLNPVWEVAAELAQETRRRLNFSADEPIPSLRELCHRLQVPFVRSKLPERIAGATLATGAVRGIVLNVAENGRNVLVRRATVAHELGHLLWDPNERLKSLVVDDYSQIERIEHNRDTKDWVEPRANAFAVELLAPQDAVRNLNRGLNTSDPDEVAVAIRRSMDRFGVSRTAMHYHLWNAFRRDFDFDAVSSVDPTPTEDWEARERYTDDYFPLGDDTPIERRGEFAALVVRAEREKWLTEQVAAFYLNVSPDVYRSRADEILSLYPV